MILIILSVQVVGVVNHLKHNKITTALRKVFINGIVTELIITIRRRGNMKAYIGIKYYEDYSNKMVVIDLTEKGVGLGIEAGYAYAKGIPIITMAKKDSDISETLEGISEKIFFYDDIENIEISL